MIPLSPKQRLHQNEAARKNAASVIETIGLPEVLEVAFAEFCYHLPSSENPAKGWNANCLRDGAKRFMNEVLTLADKSPPPPKKMDSGSLLPDSQTPGMVFNPLSSH